LPFCFTPFLRLLLFADTNFDYPGSCGRCYEVRCKSGLVEDRGAPVSIEQFYYLAKVNSNVQDTYGRSFPGKVQQREPP
jgi:cullin-associated NEDD8-dissociated protein 1